MIFIQPCVNYTFFFISKYNRIFFENDGVPYVLDQLDSFRYR